jgi:hypothetical protein
LVKKLEILKFVINLFEELLTLLDRKKVFGMVVMEEDDGKSEMDHQAVRDRRCFKDNPSGEFAK